MRGDRSARLMFAILLLEGMALLIPALQDKRIPEPDEAYYLETALRMPRMGFDPGGYLHGSLPLNLLAIEMGALYLASRLLHIVGSPEGFLALYIEQPELFMRAARLLVVAVFLLALWGFARTLQRLAANQTLAVAGFLVLATNPAIVFSAWFVKAEAFALAGLAWAAYFATSARPDCSVGSASPPKYRILASAVCFGLAVASGYLAVFAAPMLALILWPCASDMKSRWRMWIGYTAASLTAFAAGEPYGLLNVRRLIQEVLAQQGLMAQSPEVTLPLWPKILYEFHFVAVGLPTCLMLVIAVFLGLWAPRRWVWAYVLTPLITISYFANARGGFFRYVALGFPFYFLFALSQFDQATGVRPRLRVGMVWLFLSLAASQVWDTAKFASYLGRPSTASAAASWIAKNVPADSRMVVEGLVVDQVFWCPQVPKSKAALSRDMSTLQARGAKGGLVRARLDRCCAPPVFDVIELGDIDGETLPAGGAYVVTCLDGDHWSFLNVEAGHRQEAIRERDSRRTRALANSGCAAIKRFEPSILTRGPLIDTADFAAILGSSHADGLAGPAVTVYRCDNTKLAH